MSCALLKIILVLSHSPRQSQAALPTTLHLQSSATLGTGKATTHRDRLDKLEDKEIRRALDGRAGKRRRQDDSYAVTGPDVDMDDEELEDDAPPPTQLSGPSNPPVTSVPPAVGSALQRNPDGSVVAPRIIPKSREKKVRPPTRSVDLLLRGRNRLPLKVGKIKEIRLPQSNQTLLSIAQIRQMILRKKKILVHQNPTMKMTNRRNPHHPNAVSRTGL